MDSLEKKVYFLFSSSFLRFKVSLLFDDLITGKGKDKRTSRI